MDTALPGSVLLYVVRWRPMICGAVYSFFPRFPSEHGPWLRFLALISTRPRSDLYLYSHFPSDQIFTSTHIFRHTRSLPLFISSFTTSTCIRFLPLLTFSFRPDLFLYSRFPSVQNFTSTHTFFQTIFLPLLTFSFRPDSYLYSHFLPEHRHGPDSGHGWGVRLDSSSV